MSTYFNRSRRFPRRHPAEIERSDMETVVENRRRWVEALRSGEYAQGTHALRESHHNYCCLGVACDAVLNVEWELKEQCYRQNGQRVILTLEQLSALGLTRKTEEELISMNDYHDAGFSQIADFIETLPYEEV